MSGSRPLPQYGEYATPEEVAALRGMPLEEVHSAAVVPAPGAPAPEVPSAGVPTAATRVGFRRYDRAITIALLVFGAINSLQYAGPLLDFETFLERATVGTPTESIDFGDATRIGGIVLFAVSLVLLVAAVAVSVLLMRRDKLTSWVPLAAGALVAITWVVVIVAIVMLTPDAVPPPTTSAGS